MSVKVAPSRHTHCRVSRKTRATLAAVARALPLVARNGICCSRRPPCFQSRYRAEAGARAREPRPQPEVRIASKRPDMPRRRCFRRATCGLASPLRGTSEFPGPRCAGSLYLTLSELFRGRFTRENGLATKGCRRFRNGKSSRLERGGRESCGTLRILFHTSSRPARVFAENGTPSRWDMPRRDP